MNECLAVIVFILYIKMKDFYKILGSINFDLGYIAIMCIGFLVQLGHLVHG